jgi:hypothetical protein
MPAGACFASMFLALGGDISRAEAARPSAQESGWVPQQGSPTLAKPAHSLNSEDAPTRRGQHGLGM